MEDKNVKYCTYCGTKCTDEMAICPNCQKYLDPKENLFVEYLISKTKDKYKGDLEDSIIDAIINFIKSHLYGVILTISIVSVAFTGVVSGDGYIKRVTKEPGSEIIEVKPHYSNDQKDIIEVVDDYFYYARNIDKKANAQEKLKSLMSPIITTEVMPGYPVTSSHEAVEVDGVDSASYQYAFVDSDIKYATTIISAEFMAKGYRVAEVFAYETLKSGNETKEEAFLVTLIQDGNKWTVNESLSSYEDPKLAEYEWDVLYLIAGNVLMPYNQRYSVEEIELSNKPYVMPSKGNGAANITIEASDDCFYWMVDLEFDIIYETSLAKQLQKAGYRVAQGTLKCREYNTTDTEGVITFVNMDGMWYVAEMTMGE